MYISTKSNVTYINSYIHTYIYIHMVNEHALKAAQDPEDGFARKHRAPGAFTSLAPPVKGDQKEVLAEAATQRGEVWRPAPGLWHKEPRRWSFMASRWRFSTCSMVFLMVWKGVLMDFSGESWGERWFSLCLVGS